MTKEARNELQSSIVMPEVEVDWSILGQYAPISERLRDGFDQVFSHHSFGLTCSASCATTTRASCSLSPILL